MLYSAVVLKGLLPDLHYQCWHLFVRACSILSERTLKKCDLVTADLLLLNFCKQFQQLYGNESCTPNMHLHLHLKSCLLDYGPSHTFRCYSFEQYNGMLGSFHTNKKSIESQIMRKFVNLQQLQSAKVFAKSELLSVFPSQQSSFSALSSVSSNEETVTLLGMSTMSLNNVPPPFFHDK